MPGLLDFMDWLNSGATVGTRLRSLDAKNRGSNTGLLSGYAAPDAVLNSEPANAASGLLGPMGAVGLGGVMTYHGTPHKFDKFDLSKIGTGEGAQVYGHGIYFAENPKTAAFYKTSLTPPRLAEAQQINELLPPAHRGTSDNAYRVLTDIQDAMTRGDITHAKDYLKTFEVASELRPAYEKAQQIVSGKGAMYKQDLPDKILPKMLHWDDPLSKHPIEVQQALAPLLDVAKKRGPLARSLEGDPTLGTALSAIKYDQGSGAVATDLLSKAGFPGLSYLDAGSRAGGKGTLNHVIWDQSLLDRMIPQAIE